MHSSHGIIPELGMLSKKIDYWAPLPRFNDHMF
jgi:hypothetical protein